MGKTDYRLRIDAVRGESKRLENGIDILSFEFSTDNTHDAMTGQAHGRRRYSDVTFTKIVDQASPVIQALLARNAMIKKATLTCQKMGADRTMFCYYELILSDAVISYYKLRGQELADEFGPIPREEFKINFGKIEVNYTLQGTKGSGEGSTSFSDELHQGT